MGYHLSPLQDLFLKRIKVSLQARISNKNGHQELIEQAPKLLSLMRESTRTFQELLKK